MIKSGLDHWVVLTLTQVSGLFSGLRFCEYSLQGPAVSRVDNASLQKNLNTMIVLVLEL